MKLNGYEIKWNGFWKEWQTYHDEIGHCEDFKTLKEAMDYCKKG